MSIFHRYPRKAERLPRIALRNDHAGRLDDVVVKDVEMFRAEMMSDKSLWMACYLTNGERITWHVSHRGRVPLEFDVSEVPAYEDFDDGHDHPGNEA